MNDVAFDMNQDAFKQPALLITRKVLSQTANQFMANAAGVYSQQDVFEVVMEAAESANRKTLIEEVAWAVTTETINRRATPRLTHSKDWIGYSEMAIKLPEAKIVNVYYAEMAALEHRKSNVIENKDKIIKASNEEIERITEVQAMMIKINVPTAGPAIETLKALAA